MKIYTYMHAGKPIIATRVRSHTQVLDDHTSILAAPTKEEFAAAILRLAAEPKLRLELSNSAANALAARSNFADYVERVDRLLRQLNGTQASSVQPALPAESLQPLHDA
jgi:glycosyltransferase involved in cell wall biosynthesis